VLLGNGDIRNQRSSGLNLLNQDRRLEPVEDRITVRIDKSQAGRLAEVPRIEYEVEYPTAQELVDDLTGLSRELQR
jgi:hypothetical protein